MLNRFKRAVAARVALMLVVALACVAPVSAQTAYDGITAAVDWSDVVTGITAIAALVAAVLVVMRGSRLLLRMIGR